MPKTLLNAMENSLDNEKTGDVKVSIFPERSRFPLPGRVARDASFESTLFLLTDSLYPSLFLPSPSS